MVDAIDYNEKFDSSKGFFVAAALTAYDNETEVIEDPTYGELVIEQFGWGYEESFRSESRDLDYHYCSDEELGLV